MHLTKERKLKYQKGVSFLAHLFVYGLFGIKMFLRINTYYVCVLLQRSGGLKVSVLLQCCERVLMIRFCSGEKIHA